MPIIDNGVYVAGARIENPTSLSDTFEYMRARGGMAWIGMFRPTPEEIHAVADEFSLHPLAVEDALTGHQRSKLERYGDTLFIVLRPARYIDESETVEFGELHLFVGPDFVVTIRHAESPDLARVRHRLETQSELLARGPEAVLYAILDEVVDEYVPVLAGVENDIDEIEDTLFTGGDPGLSRRIYELSREVLALQRATQPLADMLDGLLRGADKYGVDLELQRSLRDVQDHALKTIERITAFRVTLENALTVNATLVTQRQTDTSLAQNEQVKKISGWAAIPLRPHPGRHDLRHETSRTCPNSTGRWAIRARPDGRHQRSALRHLQEASLALTRAADPTRQSTVVPQMPHTPDPGTSTKQFGQMALGRSTVAVAARLGRPGARRACARSPVLGAEGRGDGRRSRTGRTRHGAWDAGA
jgi:magnesium transporter